MVQLDLLGHVVVGIDGADEDGLVLAHAGVDEHEGGVVERDGVGGGPEGVRLLLHEEVEEGLAHGGGIAGRGRHIGLRFAS